MNATQNNNVPYIIIIILLIIIAVLAFFVGKSQNSGATATTPTTQDLTVTVIDDKRCTDCNTLATLEQLKAVPGLANATFEVKDFSDKGSDEILKETGLNKLPAFIFEHNKVGDLELAKYLVATKDERYYLNIGSKFNPYAKRSERGFLLLEDGVLDQIKSNSHVYGDKNAEISWVEYSDVQCTYCKKLHNDGTHDKLFEAYGKDLNLYYQYYAIFNKEIPEVLECMVEQKGVEIQYPTLKTIFKKELTAKNDVVALVPGINKDKLDKCISE